MSVHQYDHKMRQDHEFIQGDVEFLVKGNQCRLLDGRRTTGFIEEYFEDSAMFRWRITKYEDEGKYWDLPAENITRFQFEKESKRLNKNQVKDIQDKITKYQEKLSIEATQSERHITEQLIDKTKSSIRKWLVQNSSFIKNKEKLDFTSNEGSEYLADDLKRYFKSIGLNEEENITAETFVLNPNSGEWVKGIKIVLAEMGLVSFNGKVPRTKNIFKGIGSKENRRSYIIHRLAFVRAYFSLLDIKEVVIFRGMSNEQHWKDIERTFLPCTFSLEVAKAFSSIERDSKYKSSYLVKMTMPVEKLFMTYLETESMNKQYKESEVLILHDREYKL